MSYNVRKLRKDLTGNRCRPKYDKIYDDKLKVVITRSNTKGRYLCPVEKHQQSLSSTTLTANLLDYSMTKHKIRNISFKNCVTRLKFCKIMHTSGRSMVNKIW